MILPPPPRLDQMPAGKQLPAGIGKSTILPDVDFETYSEAGYVWDEVSQKWAGPAGAPKGKKGLPVVGAAVYAGHESTEVICAAYDLKDGRGRRHWHPGAEPPVDLLAHVIGGGLIEAHNSGFEWWIWNNVCARIYGWPTLPIEQMRCSAAKSRAHALPGALAKVGEVLAIEHQKDPEGERLMAIFSMPRNPTKTDPRRRILPLWDADQAKIEAMALADAGLKPAQITKLIDAQLADTLAYARYNDRDIVAESEVSALVPDQDPEELRVWITDQEINRRGMAVDLQSVRAACDVIDQAEAQFGDEMARLTGGIRPSEVAKLLGWLHGRGIHMDSLDEEAVTHALTWQLDEDSRRVLEIRAAAGSASVKKVRTMRNMASHAGRLHDLYTYHGARTGRPTGNDAQPTNLPRSGPHCWKCAHCGHYHNTSIGGQCPWCGTVFNRADKKHEWSPESMEDAITVLRCGSLDLLAWYFTDALHAVAGTLRGLFVAAPGHTLISSDFSAIEGVVIAALAGEQWRLDVFAGHGMIYEMSAAKILGLPFEDFVRHKKETGKHHPGRQMPGKVAELGLGFGGWINAWRQFGGPGTDEEVKANILAWREASPAIVHLWGGQRLNWKPCLYGLEGAAIQAMHEPGRWHEVVRLNGTLTSVAYGKFGDVLYCRLPSGRLITYHRPRLAPADQEWRGMSLSFEGWNSNPKNGPIGWIRMSTYSGKLAENVTQATARDIQMHAIENLRRAGYPTVMHTYDEIVAEVPVGFGSVEELERLMMSTPAWAKGWPIKAAGGWMADRYRKG